MSVQCKCWNCFFISCLHVSDVFSLKSGGWCCVTVAGKSLLASPERGSVIHGATMCTQVIVLPPWLFWGLPFHFSSALCCIIMFLIWCTSLAMLQIPPSMESSPQQFHTDDFRAHSEIPPLCSIALCFTKSDSETLPFYNASFISIKVHHSFHLISVASYVLCKEHCPSSSSFILVATFWRLR